MEAVSPNDTLARLEALKEEGNAQFKGGKYEAAIDAYSRCLAEARAVTGEPAAKDASSSPQAVDKAAPQTAASDSKRVAEVAAQTLCNRALCYQRTNQFAAAEADCTDAVALLPSYVKGYYRRACARQATGNLKACVEDLQTCLRLQPANKEAREMLASVRDKVMEEEDARVQQHLPENLIASGLDAGLSVGERVSSLRQLGAFVQERKLQRQFQRDGSLKRIAAALKTQMERELESAPASSAEAEARAEAAAASDTKAGSQDASSLPISVEAACWELLLSVVQKHHRAADDDEDGSSKSAPASVEELNAPLEVEAPILESRQALAGFWSSNDFLVRARQLLRAGVAPPQMGPAAAGAAVGTDVEAGKRRAVWRGEACDRMLRTMGCVAELHAAKFEDDTSFLEACAAGMECSGSAEVQRAGVAALVGVADARRRLGGRAQALQLRQVLEKCLEDALQIVAEAEHELAGGSSRRDLVSASAGDHGAAASDRVESAGQLEGQADYLIITLIALLADKCRGKEDPPDMNRLVDQLLAPYFRPSDDPEESLITLTVGLKGLRLVLTAARDVARTYLLSASSILTYLLAAAAGGACGSRAQRRQQEAALEVLLACMDFPELRTNLLDSNAVPILAQVCSEEAGDSRLGCWMRARVAAALARLSVHDEDVRIQVFDSIDFYQVLEQLLTEIRVAGGDGRHQLREDAARKQTAVSARDGSIVVGEETFRSLLEIFFFLSLHADFKKLLASDDKKGTRLLRTLLQVANAGGGKRSSDGRPKARSHSSLARYLLLQSLCNIMRSREDKERQRRKKCDMGSPLADIDDEQLEQLEELFKKLPPGAKPAANGEVDLGDKALAAQLRETLMDLNVVSVIVKSVCSIPSPSANVLCAAAQALKFLCAEPSHRGQIVREGGIRALLTAASRLEDYPDDQRNARQAAAQLCITSNPSLFSYREVLDLVPCLTPLLKDSHELLQYEGAIALINLSSLNEEVRTRAWLGDAWAGFEDLLFSENDLLRAAGLEGWCNLSASPAVQEEIGNKMERFAEKKQEVQDVKLMLAFTRETNNPRAQNAAISALAMLLANEKVATYLPDYSFFGNIETVLDAATEKEEALTLRCVSALYNVWEELCTREETTKKRKHILEVVARNQQKLKGSAAQLATQMLTWKSQPAPAAAEGDEKKEVSSEST
ncbi:tetratricopeptide repeat-containing protein [Besnoitia besnoiti]|uniref:Tetratricopeptide repeat-containing protein n=1 Tax=Besnoitia besnoiti TaxID=94643 RepID=A0A2A9MLE3_BESBE|nr:tetratricopeptide repeat-containing protein [Besnoitia besnoiti]PFH38074.1 tetratricopeptide repeat-containing protein [Besnoitia besnoiti]